MLKIRRPLGRLIFNMGIAIPGKTVFLIETAPCIQPQTKQKKVKGQQHGWSTLHGALTKLLNSAATTQKWNMTNSLLRYEHTGTVMSPLMGEFDSWHCCFWWILQWKICDCDCGYYVMCLGGMVSEACLALHAWSIELSIHLVADKWTINACNKWPLG